MKFASIRSVAAALTQMFALVGVMLHAQRAHALDTALSVTIASGQSFNAASSPLGGLSGCGMVTGSHYFDSKAIIVGVDGTYSFAATSATLSNGGDDSFLALYRATFNPASPTANLQGCDDDSGPGVLPLMALAGLTSGQVYVLVNTTFGTGHTGAVDLTVSGPGLVTVLEKPTITSEPVTGATATSALGHGTITALGGITAYERGFVWGTSLNPTILGNKTVEVGSFGLGPFTGTIDGLTPNTSYHLRAYATNPSGTAYGADVVFSSDPARVPTLSEWGMIIMFTLMLLSIAFVIDRQTRHGASA